MLLASGHDKQAMPALKALCLAALVSCLACALSASLHTLSDSTTEVPSPNLPPCATACRFRAALLGRLPRTALHCGRPGRRAVCALRRRRHAGRAGNRAAAAGRGTPCCRCAMGVVHAGVLGVRLCGRRHDGRAGNRAAAAGRGTPCCLCAMGGVQGFQVSGFAGGAMLGALGTCCCS